MTSARYSDLRLYARLLREARPYWGHLAVVLALGLLATPMTLLTPVPLKVVVDHVIGSRPLPAWLAALLPSAVEQSPGALLGVAIAALVLVTLLQQGEGYASWVLQLYTGERMVLDFRTRLFRHAQRLSLGYHDNQGVADSLYRIQHDAPAIQYLLVQGAVPAVTSVLMVVSMLFVTAMIDAQLALVAVAVVPVLVLLTELYRRRVRRGWAAVKQQESTAMSVVQEVLAAVRVVRAFGQESREQQRFSDHASRSLGSQVRVVLTESVFGLLVALAIACGSGAVLFVGAQHVRADTLSLGDLLVVMAYLAMLYKPLETLSKKVATLQSSLASAERAYRLLDEQVDVPESPSARPLQRARGAVSFENVAFAYPGRPDVLRGVSLRVEPGTSVGISGPTGAGKTTLVSLLFRFFDPTDGRVTLDGVDLRDYRVADLRNQFGVVLQEPVLFAATVMENIAYGRPGATEQEVIQAAKAAHADGFIERLPDGYDTVVGQRGAGLSGGERQRISLARAFLKDPPILVLDEPTSSVDSESEAMIIDAMRELMRDRTTFMIAHRLSTLDCCGVRWHVEQGGVSVVPSSASVGSAPRQPSPRERVT